MSHPNPYKVIYMPGHPRASTNGCIYEHLYIAEKKIGRKLNETEVVHHIDGNKQNNNPDNLIVFATNADHILCHQGCEIYEVDGIWHSKKKQTPSMICEYCGKEFIPLYTRKYGHIYCSNECRAMASMKIPKISKERLCTCLEENNGNFTKVASMFGITDNAIRKRCKKCGLPFHSSDYK